MKIITRAVLDWDGNVLEEDSYEYSGPIAQAKSSGSAPQPVDPWTQAAAEYQLDTGTANYNAGLNRTNTVNPLGSSTWTSTQQQPSSPSGGAPGSYGPYSLPGGGLYGFGGNFNYAGGGLPSFTGSPGGAYGFGGSGAPPTYTNTTSLAPWANAELSQPIDTSNIPGMPGGPSLEQNVGSAENATFNQEMGLLQPQEKLQSEQTQSQLENEGAMPGSPAYSQGEDELARQQGFENAQVANQAVTTGMGELPMLYGLGSTSLQNQLAARQAPISEYDALNGAPSTPVSAATPDIGSAFGQQYQGQLAGYNAQNASNNATTGAITSLAAMAAIYF